MIPAPFYQTGKDCYTNPRAPVRIRMILDECTAPIPHLPGRRTGIPQPGFALMLRGARERA